MRFAALAMFFACGLAAQDKPAPPKDPPPSIPAELRARFWRAQAEAILAEAEAQRKRTTANAISKEGSDVCGVDHLLVVHQGYANDPMNGEIECQAKPKEKK